MIKNEQYKHSMISQIGMTFQIWFEAIAKPGKVLGILRLDTDYGWEFCPIWYIVLLIIGLRKTIQINWWRGSIIALVFNAISFGMFLPIMR